MKVYKCETKQHGGYTAEDYVEEYDNPIYYDKSVKDYSERFIRFINYVQKIEGTVPKEPLNLYEFVNDSGYDESELPSFAELIFNEPNLSNNAKEEFKRNILDYYFFDEDFRENLDEGKVVVFINDKLQKLYKDENSTKGISKIGDDVRLFPTTKTLEKILSNKIVNSRKEIGGGGGAYKCFNIDVTTLSLYKGKNFIELCYKC